jgi:hypothetical protein
MNDVDRSASWPMVSESALVRAMRQAQPEAVDEFIRRFGGITLCYARRLGIPPDDRSKWAADVLFDVALTVSASNGRLSRGLTTHVLATCMLKRPRTELTSC